MLRKYLFFLAPAACILLLAIGFIAYFGKLNFNLSFLPPSDSQPVRATDSAARPEGSIKTSEDAKEGTAELDKIEPIANLDLRSTKIPILMYHHIRDYHSESDKIGTNLSVSPAQFVKQLDYLVAHGYTTITFRDLTTSKIPDKPIILTFDDGYDNFYDNAFSELKARNMTAVVFVITDFKKSGYLTDEELKELDQSGVELGSHTLSHPDLTIIKPDKLKSELSLSKEFLETLTGKQTTSLCYPSGRFNSQVLEEAQKIGYDYAVTTRSGIGDFASPLELQRFRINPGTKLEQYLQ